MENMIIKIMNSNFITAETLQQDLVWLPQSPIPSALKFEFVTCIANVHWMLMLSLFPGSNVSFWTDVSSQNGKWTALI